MFYSKEIYLLISIVCFVNSEELVQGNCGQGFKRCEIGACISEKYVCDGIVQCPDETDEKYCAVTEKPKTELIQGTCIDGYVQCDNENICMQKKYICDGKFDCPDQSDEKYCNQRTSNAEESTVHTFTEVPSHIEEGITMEPALTSDEETEQGSDENGKDFLTGEDFDHCNHYKRMIALVRRVNVKLTRMDQKTAHPIRHLINEILMEAGMENFSSLLELHTICNNTEKDKKPRRHHRRTTTSTTTPSYW